jgi:DNA primase
MADNSPENWTSKSTKARRQRRVTRDFRRNIRKLHRELVETLAQPGADGHPIGCRCDACDRVRDPEYWAERDAWQAAHPGADWYLRND